MSESTADGGDDEDDNSDFRNTDQSPPTDVRGELIASLIAQNEILTSEVAKLTAVIGKLNERLTSNIGVNNVKTNVARNNFADKIHKRRRLLGTASDVDASQSATNAESDNEMDYANDALDDTIANESAIANQNAIAKLIDNQLPSTSAIASTNAQTSATANKSINFRQFLWSDIVNGVCDTQHNINMSANVDASTQKRDSTTELIHRSYQARSQTSMPPSPTFHEA